MTLRENALRSRAKGAAGSLTAHGKERLCRTGSHRLLVEVHQTELSHRSKHSARFGSPPENSAIWLCNLIIKRSSSRTRQCLCLMVLRWQMNPFWFVNDSESTEFKKIEEEQEEARRLEERLITQLECSRKVSLRTREEHSVAVFCLFFAWDAFCH